MAQLDKQSDTSEISARCSVKKPKKVINVNSNNAEMSIQFNSKLRMILYWIHQLVNRH